MLLTYSLLKTALHLLSMETGADAKTHKTRTRHISRKHGHEDKQDSPHGDEWSGHDTPSPCVKTQLSNGDDGVVSDSSDRKRSLSLSIDERATKYVKCRSQHHHHCCVRDEG